MTPAPRRGGAATRERTLAKPAPSAERDETQRLLREYRTTRDPRVRERLVELNSDLVHYIARRFANRGEPLEDIEQVGFVGLIQAIERFDPSLENEFSTFATPTIAGEIRRYFRDRSWAVRVPRRLQENLIRVNGASQQLQHELGRAPSIAEIAARLGIEPDEVLAALEVSPAQHTVSLESTGSSLGEDTATLGERLGREDENLERVEAQGEDLALTGGEMRHHPLQHLLGLDACQVLILLSQSLSKRWRLLAGGGRRRFERHRVLRG